MCSKIVRDQGRCTLCSSRIDSKEFTDATYLRNYEDFGICAHCSDLYGDHFVCDITTIESTAITDEFTENLAESVVSSGYVLGRDWLDDLARYRRD